MVRVRINMYGIIFSVISVFLMSGCNILEPENRLASLYVQLAKTDADVLAKTQNLLDQMNCIIKDGSGTAVYDTTISPSGETFVFRVDGLDAGSRYEVILYGIRNSRIVVRANKNGIVLEKGKTRKVLLSWKVYTVSLVSPYQGSTILDNTPQFRWNEVAGASAYELVVDNQSSFNDPEIYETGVLISYFNTSDTLPDAKYYWRVRCIDSQNISGGWSETGYFTIDTQGPASPELYMPENGYTINDGTPFFSWSSPGSAVLYELIADDSGDFSSPEIEQNTLTGSEYSTTEILSDRTYFWRVRAVDEHGNRGAWSDTWTFTLDSLGIVPAELFSPMNGSSVTNESLVFDWRERDDALEYELLVDNNTDFSSPEIHEEQLTRSGYTSEFPLEYDTYVWKVRSRNDDDKWWSWSETWSFTLKRTSGTVTDADGNVYETVKIGTQWWMAENLKVTHYRNGDPIEHVPHESEWKLMSSGAYCSYDSYLEYADEYGYLYNWYALNDSRNLAPEGWHVPSDEEWQILVDYLGGHTVAGSKLKEAGTDHWQAPNSIATNSSGFTAIPGGARNDIGGFSGLGSYAFFWSITEYSSYFVYTRVLSDDYIGISNTKYSKQNGFSVRLIKD